MIPQTLDEWEECITKKCKINLTKEFAAERLAVYQDRNNAETKKFIAIYGEQHLQNIIDWYKRIL